MIKSDNNQIKFVSMKFTLTTVFKIKYNRKKLSMNRFRVKMTMNKSLIRGRSLRCLA